MKSLSETILGRALGLLADAMTRYRWLFLWPQIFLFGLCVIYTDPAPEVRSQPRQPGGLRQDVPLELHGFQTGVSRAGRPGGGGGKRGPGKKPAVCGAAGPESRAGNEPLVHGGPLPERLQDAGKKSAAVCPGGRSQRIAGETEQIICRSSRSSRRPATCCRSST